MKFAHVEKQSDGNGGGAFLKIEDGKSVNGVFRGELYTFYQSWPQGGTKQIYDVPTAGASMRFKANVVIFEDGKFVAKVWEFPVTVNNMLYEIAGELDITKTKCKISRLGSGKKTQWMVFPLGPLDAKALKQVEAVELLPLAGQAAQPDTGDNGEF